MNKYIVTLIFYLISFVIIFVLTKVSPNAQDGGLGWGGFAMMLLGLILVILIGINTYKGLSRDKEYFIIAGIHMVILAGGLYAFFV